MAQQFFKRVDRSVSLVGADGGVCGRTVHPCNNSSLQMSMCWWYILELVTQSDLPFKCKAKLGIDSVARALEIHVLEILKAVVR